MRRPATLRSLTCHIGSENDERLAASESCSSGTRRLAREPSATAKTSICSDPAPDSVPKSTASFCMSSWQTRDRPMRTFAATAHAMRGSRRSSAFRLGATDGLTFSRIATRSWLIGPAGPWSVDSACRSAWTARSSESASGVVSR